MREYLITLEELNHKELKEAEQQSLFEEDNVQSVKGKDNT